MRLGASAAWALVAPGCLAGAAAASASLGLGEEASLLQFGEHRRVVSALENAVLDILRARPYFEDRHSPRKLPTWRTVSDLPDSCEPEEPKLQGDFCSFGFQCGSGCCDPAQKVCMDCLTLATVPDDRVLQKRLEAPAEIQAALQQTACNGAAAKGAAECSCSEGRGCANWTSGTPYEGLYFLDPNEVAPSGCECTAAWLRLYETDSWACREEVRKRSLVRLPECQDLWQTQACENSWDDCDRPSVFTNCCSTCRKAMPLPAGAADEGPSHADRGGADGANRTGALAPPAPAPPAPAKQAPAPPAAAPPTPASGNASRPAATATTPPVELSGKATEAELDASDCVGFTLEHCAEFGIVRKLCPAICRNGVGGAVAAIDIAAEVPRGTEDALMESACEGFSSRLCQEFVVVRDLCPTTCKLGVERIPLPAAGVLWQAAVRRQP